MFQLQPIRAGSDVYIKSCIDRLIVYWLREKDVLREEDVDFFFSFFSILFSSLFFSLISVRDYWVSEIYILRKNFFFRFVENYWLRETYRLREKIYISFLRLWLSTISLFFSLKSPSVIETTHKAPNNWIH